MADIDSLRACLSMQLSTLYCHESLSESQLNSIITMAYFSSKFQDEDITAMTSTDKEQECSNETKEPSPAHVSVWI